MDIGKKLNKRPIKLLALLLTSMLIATTSAATYYSLVMQPQVTTATPMIKFSSGIDTPSGSIVNNAYCLLALNSYPNATLTYGDAVNLTNTDSAKAHSVQLTPISIWPNSTTKAGNWTSIKFYLFAQNNTQITSLSYTQSGGIWTSSGTTSYYSIPPSQVWYIEVQTLSPATATIGFTLNIVIGINVKA
jgi:hypothetical protein